MGSIKIMLRESKKKPDGTMPLVIRVIKDRKTKFVFLGHYIKETDWDVEDKKVKKSHPNSAALNHLIFTKLSETSNLLIDAQTDNKEVSSVKLKSKIKNINISSFSTVAQGHLNDLEKLNKFNQLAGEKPRVNHFKKFLNNEDIGFSNITPALLKRFMIYLKVNVGLNDRSVMNTLIVIRTVFNRAIQHDLVDRKYYPFGPGKIQIKFPESVKIGLNEKEVRLMAEVKLDAGSKEWHARNIWLASFYLAGVRVSDIIKLKWTDIYDGRIHYVMGKNNKIVSLKLPEKVVDILDLYKSRKKGFSFVFPYLKDEDEENIEILHSHTRTANHVINENLKLVTKKAKIKKKVTMHISRHTFGNIAGDRISPQMLQKLYRHSDLKTTIGYQANFIHKDTDKALESVLNF